MPWMCDEIFTQPSTDGSKRTTTKAAINLMARLYKGIEVLSCLSASDAGIRDPGRNEEGRAINPWGYSAPLYYYNNPVMGDVLGSIFPPTDEDTYISNNNGYILNYWGGYFPSITFVGSDGIVHKLPPPRTLIEKHTFDAQLKAWQDANAARLAAQAEASRTAASNVSYLETQYQDSLKRGLDTSNVDGLTWHATMFTWNDVIQFTPDMIGALSIGQWRQLQGVQSSLSLTFQQGFARLSAAQSAAYSALGTKYGTRKAL